MEFHAIFVFIHVILQSTLTSSDVTVVNKINIDETKSKLLSRRKRFLVFPEASSFQLVFCTQHPGYLQVGDIVWFGSTAALAWELPTDPQIFDTLRDRNKVYQASKRTNVIHYVDEDGKEVDSVEYQRKPIINPAFAKRSIPLNGKRDIFIKNMHNMRRKTSFFEDLDAARIDFHRNGRQSLYRKLEKFLHELGLNGRMCILKMLCTSGKVKKEQGTFVEEILTAIFTFPISRGFTTEDGFYDVDQGTNADCTRLYPECV